MPNVKSFGAHKKQAPFCTLRKKYKIKSNFSRGKKATWMPFCKNGREVSFIIKKLVSIFKTEILGKMSILLPEACRNVVKQDAFVQCGQSDTKTLAHLLKEKIEKQEI